MIYFTAHTFNCVCHSIRTMFRVLGIYNFDSYTKEKVSKWLPRKADHHCKKMSQPNVAKCVLLVHY